MDSMRKRRLFWLILSLVWMLLIYVLSAQPGNESAALSDRFVALLDVLGKQISKQGMAACFCMQCGLCRNR